MNERYATKENTMSSETRMKIGVALIIAVVVSGFATGHSEAAPNSSSSDVARVHHDCMAAVQAEGNGKAAANAACWQAMNALPVDVELDSLIRYAIELMDSPIPPGRGKPPSKPRPVPDRKGYGIVVLEKHRDGNVSMVGLRVEVPGKDLRAASWKGAERMREAEFLSDVRGAIREAGLHAGKSEKWIASAQSQITEASLEHGVDAVPMHPEIFNTPYCKFNTDGYGLPLIDFEKLEEASTMLSGGATVSPECGGGSYRGCGSIVCASVMKFHGQIIGCKPGCGGCAIVTVCG